MIKRRTVPAPVVTPETQVFWDAARGGRLLLPTCATCGLAHWYPRAVCPFCPSDKIEWREASGRGEIYSFSVMRRAKEPYVIAYVTLAEGPTMLTNTVDVDPDTLRIGMPVVLTFVQSDGGPPVPMFKPA